MSKAGGAEAEPTLCCTGAEAWGDECAKEPVGKLGAGLVLLQPISKYKWHCLRSGERKRMKSRMSAALLCVSISCGIRKTSGSALKAQ